MSGAWKHSTTGHRDREVGGKNFRSGAGAPRGAATNGARCPDKRVEFYMRALLRSTAIWILLLPYAVYFTGAALNQLAMNANGDLMPVRINVVKAIEWFGTPVEFGEPAPDKEHHIILLPDGTAQLDGRHCLMTSRTHFNWVSDIFDFHSEIDSIGDLLLSLSEFLKSFCWFGWICVVAERARRP